MVWLVVAYIMADSREMHPLHAHKNIRNEGRLVNQLTTTDDEQRS